MVSRSIRRIRGGGNLAVPWQALLALSAFGRGLRALFFCAEACEGVEQASITGGEEYGEHGQRSGAIRSIGTADRACGHILV